jgi:hypothetical protein
MFSFFLHISEGKLVLICFDLLTELSSSTDTGFLYVLSVISPGLWTKFSQGKLLVSVRRTMGVQQRVHGAITPYNHSISCVSTTKLEPREQVTFSKNIQ